MSVLGPFATRVPSLVPLPSNGPSLPDLLFIEEQRSVREACKDAAAACGYNVSVCDSASQAIRMIDAKAIDIAFVSIKGSHEVQLVRELKQRRPQMEIIVLSSDPRVECAVEAIKAGAYEFVPKPLKLQRLISIVQCLTQSSSFQTRYQQNRCASPSGDGVEFVEGQTAATKAIHRMIAKCAHASHPVLITGECGTGKELLARAIHDAGSHREHPFVVVDCGAIDAEGLDPALFGCVQQNECGSTRAGILESVKHGTVFFTDVDKLSTALQAKLSRVLSTKQLQPVGGFQSISVSMRIIAASEKNLRDLVTSGAFRRDLYFGLSVLALRTPPLRERPDDILTLTQQFLDQFSRQSGKTIHLSAEALELLISYSWPGNVRELKHCIATASANCSGLVIRPTDLPADLHAPMRNNAQPLASQDAVSLRDMERNAILAAITRAGGDKIKAAAQLGIGKTTLYRKLKEYGVGPSWPGSKPSMLM